MPANVKLRPRMQRLLSPAIAQAELIGIFAWLAVLLVDRGGMLGWPVVLVTLGLCVVYGVHRVVTHYVLWRALGGFYMVLLSAGFAYVVHTRPALQVFALPLAVTLVMSSAILFIVVQDFLVCAALVWLLTWPSIQMSLYEGVDIYVFIFCAAPFPCPAPYATSPSSRTSIMARPRWLTSFSANPAPSAITSALKSGRWIPTIWKRNAGSPSWRSRPRSSARTTGRRFRAFA